MIFVLIMQQGTGQPKRLCCTSPCQCCWSPRHCCIQIDRPSWATNFRLVNHRVESNMSKPGIVHALVHPVGYCAIISHFSWDRTFVFGADFFCLQKLLTCHTYMEMEGLRQQQLLAIIPRHHKRYILPSKEHFQFPTTKFCPFKKKEKISLLYCK